MRRVRYRVRPRRPAALLGAALFLLAAALRLFWWAWWPEAAGEGYLALAVLPAAACVLYVAALWAQGRRLWITFFPAAMGVLFFVLKAQAFPPAQRWLCTALYAAVAVLYGLAMAGLPVRRLLLPLFGLPLAYHLLVEDLLLAGPGYTAAQWVQEASVLCIMGALLAVSWAMEPAERPEMAPAAGVHEKHA